MNIEYKIEKSLAERLLPQNSHEKELWEEIKNADKPIQNILKRYNRILKEQFPDSDIKTAESCSGHVKSDGSIEYQAVPPELKDNRKPLNPSIILIAPQEKIAEAKEKTINQFLEDVLSQAVIKTNEYYDKNVISHMVYSKASTVYGESLEPEQVYLFYCRAQLMETDKAVDVLQKFWCNFGEVLASYDGLSFTESYHKEDFFPKDLNPEFGLVRPE